ncbi:hypothetical protein JD969_09595 [Planctomycetota bacterium]|nr:hypothetical protein JD969_09595 [Planctomycetota bacterium]
MRYLVPQILLSIAVAIVTWYLYVKGYDISYIEYLFYPIVYLGKDLSEYADSNFGYVPLIPLALIYWLIVSTIIIVIFRMFYLIFLYIQHIYKNGL